MMNSDTSSDHLTKIRHVFEVHGPKYLEEHYCDKETHKAIYDIISCRTELQGGHLLECDHCHTIEYYYHSCHNRNCPICQHLDEIIFIEQIKHKAINVPHYEITVKLPNCLYPLAEQHKKQIYTCQMQAVKLLLQAIDRKNQYQSGSITILHTWSEHLLYFVHNHILMTKGGYSTANEQWMTNDNDHPLDLKLMNQLYVEFLAKLIHQIPAAELGLTKESQTSLCHRICAAKRRIWCGTVDEHLPNALHYLGKFRHSVGIKENQLEVLDDDWIEVKSSRGNRYCWRQEQFIERFVKHIVPNNFQKVRHYGLYANVCKKQLNIAKSACYQTTNRVDLASIDIQKSDDWSIKIEKCFGKDPLICKFCEIGHLKQIGSIAKGERTKHYRWVNHNKWVIPYLTLDELYPNDS